MNKCLALFTLSMTGLMLCECGGESSSKGTAVCEALSGCGGELEGTWVLDGFCPEGDLGALMMAHSEVPAACSDMFRDVTMDFAGTVTFAAGTETVEGSSTTHVNALYTAACISAMAGQTITSLNQQACDGAEQGAAANGGTATCALVGSACECEVTIVQSLQETQSYTIAGGTIAYSDGTSANYCVSGSKLTLRGELEAGFYMQQTLHR